MTTELQCGLLLLVVAGLRPAPRSWLTWNLDALEPPEIKPYKNELTVPDSPRATRKH